MTHRQMVETLTAERNRLPHALSKPVRKEIAESIRFFERRLKKTEAELDQSIRNSGLWREDRELMRSVKGIGNLTSLALIRGVAGTGPHLSAPRGQPGRARALCA